MTLTPTSADRHPFVRRPRRTVFALSVPVFVSLVAEPITALVDTAFVRELGATPLAGLGVGTVVLSSLFWIFQFLGTGAQTEVARALGAEARGEARALASLALSLALGFGLVLMAFFLAFADALATHMEAEGDVHVAATGYLTVRALGAPAVLLMSTSFGVLRGMQEMRAPMAIALVANLANVGLDALLIFGAGPVPALGVTGAAWASVGAQWIGAGWALARVRGHLGWTRRMHARDARRLLVVGFDLFLRTGLLVVFLLLTTRAATSASDDAGAAHQALRSVWLFAALSLDAFAATAQSLIGYFRGAGRTNLMRGVAHVACEQSVVMGCVLAVAMLAASAPVEALLVPETSRAVFAPAWRIAALCMPLNAVSFATDGVHLGTSDFSFLRNAMVAATLAGALLLSTVDLAAPGALAGIWGVTGLWIAVRALLGTLRIWPGFGPWRGTRPSRVG